MKTFCPSTEEELLRPRKEGVTLKGPSAEICVLRSLRLEVPKSQKVQEVR